MTNTPLSSAEQSKLLIFLLLMLPTLFFLVGIIPSLFLIFGLVMMKKNSDFAHIETSAKIYKWYVSIALIGCVLFALYFATTLGASDRWDRQTEEFIVSAVLAGIALFYLILINVLFLSPLRAHQQWVEANGVLSSKPKTLKDAGTEFDIIKGENLRTFSVADELIKWAKLKDDGHITEQEFNDARKKLLQ